MRELSFTDKDGDILKVRETNHDGGETVFVSFLHGSGAYLNRDNAKELVNALTDHFCLDTAKPVDHWEVEDEGELLRRVRVCFLRVIGDTLGNVERPDGELNELTSSYFRVASLA